MITTMKLTNPTPRSSVLPAFLLTAILICFALPVIPKAFGVSPPPPGGYPNYTTAVGDDALRDLNTGAYNTAAGSRALEQTTSGISNTAVGLQALQLNLSGSANTAVGVDALLSCTSSNNTAMGYSALYSDTSGSLNTAVGYSSLRSNTTGSFNTATGSFALNANITGDSNTATGWGALDSNNTGHNNTASGFLSLEFNTTGNNSTATGVDALIANTTGSSNTAAGVDALSRNSTGSFNVALGYLAGSNLTKGNNNIDIGANVLGIANEANTTRIGKQGTQKQTFIAGISGTAVTGSQVVVNASGKLGVAASSARFKEAIKPMDRASEAILALKPVTFRYREEIDPGNAPQFGLIAEEVEKVNPDLITRDESGRPVTVRYEAVNAMLLNEFLKEHRKAEEQGCQQNEEEAAIHELKSIVARQQNEINALTTSLRTVSDELERRKSAPELVADND
jgi:hypothetical protein